MAELYQQVPRDLRKNLEYRVALRKRAARDVGFQRAMMAACKHDVLFWLSAFVWVYEPRPKVVNGIPLPHQLPFIPWEHQVPAIQEIDRHLGVDDIGVEKARGEGMSWIAVMFALRDWLLFDMAKVGMVSATEDKADNPEDPDSLFWKIDWQLTKLPPWMAGAKNIDWKRNIDGHTLTNLRNGSRIAAYAATADVARGGRARWFLMDELGAFPRGPDKDALASTQHVTNCRLIVSTPRGAEGAYYEVMHEPSNMVKIILDWKDNPTRNRGLYRIEGGVPVAVDPVNNPLPPGYAEEAKDIYSRLRLKGHKLEGKLRSPWYDRECDRPGATPQKIAQELDRDYGGSMYRIFGHDFFQKAEESARPPHSRGVLFYHQETLEPDFERTDDGPVHLWCPLDHKGRPPKRKYAVGADVSSGLGGSYTSNSTIEVIDLTTMEQVLEYASNTVEPGDWADTAVAICKMFHDAYLGWEINGPGNAFTKRVKEIGYPHVYYRKLLNKRGRNATKELGWHTNKQSKEMMFSEIVRSVKIGEAVLRSARLIKECGEYVREGDRIVHVGSKGTEDDSSRGEAHGDRVIGYGVALQVARDRPLASEDKYEESMHNPPPNTLAARQKAWEEAQQREDDVWDDRDNSDMAHRLGLNANRLGGGRWT